MQHSNSEKPQTCRRDDAVSRPTYEREKSRRKAQTRRALTQTKRRPSSTPHLICRHKAANPLACYNPPTPRKGIACPLVDVLQVSCWETVSPARRRHVGRFRMACFAVRHLVAVLVSNGRVVVQDQAPGL